MRLSASRRWRLALLLPLGLALFLGAWYGLRRALRPGPPPLTSELNAQAARVVITRDEFGVPHIHGPSDADAAFGLAYAQAEDNFPLLQTIIAATRGQLARRILSKDAIANDVYVRLVGVWPETEAQYEIALSPEARAVLEGYANGLNYYAATHPDEADGRFFLVRGQDLAAGFPHKVPLFQGLDKALKAILNDEPLPVGAQLQAQVALAGEMRESPNNAALFSASLIGSNAHAVARSRSADGVVRLNINSHQPWEGPVAWYQAHVTSDEGWNMMGGTFPGGAVIFHGHNEYLGWAHTVNNPDLWDLYKLQTDPANPLRYRVDGEWLTLDERSESVAIDVGLFELPYSRKYYTSIFGPALVTDKGVYALRYAGIGQLMRAFEQWYRMNKAHNFTEWRAAMQLQGLPMFNTVYADANTIYYVYNGLLPRRTPGYDYLAVLPGDTRRTLWTDYLRYEELPQVLNPPSGLIQNCNTTPFQTTIGAGNPDPARFAPELGIETRMNNRGLRSLALFGGDANITRDEFLRYKFDREYAADAPIMREAVAPVLKSFAPQNDREREALEILRNWNRRTDESSAGASLAILTWREIWLAIEVERKPARPDPLAEFREAVEYLDDNFGRVNVPLGELQRLRRGEYDLPLGGGPDVLNAMHGNLRDGRLVGWAGESLILIVEFGGPGGAGTRSFAVQNFGQSERKTSPHYADQVPLFIKRTLHDSLFVQADLEERSLERYRPGRNQR